MILLFAAVLLLLPLEAQGWNPCKERHELNEDTGNCDWTGPKDACIELVDYYNSSWFMPMPAFPRSTFLEVDLKATSNDMDDHAVKVVVRRGCMFTGYSYQMRADAWAEHKVAENLVYGAHTLTNFINRNLAHDDQYGGLTRAQCFCDPTEATINGHEPSPPPDQRCIEHHEFDETTQQCEWVKDPKFCAEIHTTDNRRMLLEMPNWPAKKKYDVQHYYHRRNENFHMTVNTIIVRQHCFATIYWAQFHEWKTMTTKGYGIYSIPANTIGSNRYVCECIK